MPFNLWYLWKLICSTKISHYTVALTKGLSTLNPDSNQFSNRIANANSMWIQCTLIVWNEYTHVHWLQAAIAPLSDLYSSQPLYCFSRWADSWNTVCSLEKHAQGKYSRHTVHATPFYSSHAQLLIQINPDWNHLWKWIGVNPDWVNVHWVWTCLVRIQS